MTRTERLNALFDEWTQVCGGEGPFIRDGIVREEMWDTAEPKIMFLLKEVNAGIREQYKNDFRKSCDNEPWRALGRWAHGLQHLERTLEFKDFAEDEGRRPDTCSWKEAFRSSAVVNLKKTPGGTSTDWGVLQKYAEGQKVLLQKELETIDPRIVVCCGRAGARSVFGIAGVVSLYGSLEDVGRRKMGSIAADLHYEPAKRRVWLDFVHPSIRGRPMKGHSYEELYHLLVDVVRDFALHEGWHDVFPSNRTSHSTVPPSP